MDPLPFKVPKYDDLRVISLITVKIKEKEKALFFPLQRTNADLLNREFLNNVVNTLDLNTLQPLFSLPVIRNILR